MSLTEPHRLCNQGDSTNGDNAPVKPLPSQLDGVIPKNVWFKFVNHLLEAQEAVMPNSCLCCLMCLHFIETHTFGLCYLAKGPAAVVSEMNKVIEAYQRYFFDRGCIIQIGVQMNMKFCNQGMLPYVSVEKSNEGKYWGYSDTLFELYCR